MMQIGKYDVTVTSESFYIYPEDKNGETFRITVANTKIHLHHLSRDVVTFKRYTYRGEWRWNDSREKGSCSDDHVATEVARMLFNGDRTQAVQMLIGCLTGRN